MRWLPLALAFTLAGLPAAAQDAPPADPADVGSIDAIMTAVYEAISGPAGPRDWDRFRSLFAPGARLMPVNRTPEGAWRMTVLSVEDYVECVGAYFNQNPFYEEEVYRVTERYGHIAHAFSTYLSRRAPDAEPFSRGINSFQVMWDEERWWVVSIMWDPEREGQPIPAEYLGGSAR